MRAFLKAAALAAALFVLFPLVAFAQDASGGRGQAHAECN